MYRTVFFVTTNFTFSSKNNVLESYGIIIIFLPLLYSLLSVSSLMLGSIYLYYLLAILVYIYIGEQVGRLYFLLSSVVIIGYLTILQQHFSLVLALLVIANGILTSLSTFAINFLKLSTTFKAVLSVSAMLGFEQLFGGYVSKNNAHGIYGIILSIASASLVLMAVHYFEHYLTERQLLIHHLTQQANNDELTGFFNLYHLQQSFNSDIFKETVWALVMIDLDYFKSINDKYGHNVGNNVLITFSQQLKIFLDQKLGGQDFELYRYGGEEFVVIIKKGALDSEILQIFEELQIFITTIDIAQLDENLSFSAGIAYLENHAYDPLRTFEAADQLLYVAKEAGKKQIRSEYLSGN